MERAIFGVRLRYRKPASRRNEVLAREICHNVRLLAKGDGSSVYVQGPENCPKLDNVVSVIIYLCRTTVTRKADEAKILSADVNWDRLR